MNNICVHSVTDVITNSSTEIYTLAHDNAISMAKKAVNSILKAAGVSKKAEELFEFSVRVSYDRWDPDAEDPTPVKEIALTDSELKKINAAITEGFNYNGPANPSYEIIMRGDNGKEVDIMEMIGSMVYSEEYST